MRTLVAVAAIVACAGLSVTAVAQENDSTQPQGSSVGNGDGPAPTFTSAVRKAATRAGCRLRSFESAGFNHGIGALTFPQTPPVSGTHANRWADWGVYDEAVPHGYQVHNHEHGGVVVHFAGGLSDAAAEAIGEFVAAEPGYLVVTPRFSSKLVPAEPKLRLRRFPARGIVVTSWQRRLVCKSSSQRAVAAVRAYARAYRGTGREQIPAFNSGAPRPADLPEPTVNTGVAR